MAKRPPTPEKLFDQMWRPGRPFRPRISTVRRVAMGILLIVLLVVIFGYVYLTDEARVRSVAQNYLARLVGGPVKVGKAKLSIFQGLQLDDVELYLGDPKQPGALLFSAHSFLLEYSAKALLFTGNFEATRIVAVEPRVFITENADTGQRNYAKLLDRQRTASRPSNSSAKIPQLPEIVLRNAQLTYTRERDSQPLESHSIALEGQLTPIVAHHEYSFSFQSHGVGSDLGPQIAGTISTDTDQIAARLTNFEFGPDVKAMLPPAVRRWWEQHDLSGRVNIPVLNVTLPGEHGGATSYHVETELEGVTLSVRPQETLTGEQQQALQTVRGNFTALKNAAVVSPAFADSLENLVEPTSIKLTQVHGKFVFNDDETIQIDGLHGWLAEVPFQIDGTIKGYSERAAAQLHIASADGQQIAIPAAPDYLTSLPPPVREIYDRFRPRGTCKFWVDVDRPGGGGKPSLNGEIEIIDGHFVFERFPYPLDGIAGKIKLGKNPQTGQDSITLDHLVGHGPPNSINADCQLSMVGEISPLGPESHVDLIASGTSIHGDAQLVAAFPPVTRQAINIFSGPGGAPLPDFTGGFVCHILREYGIESHWTIDTDIHLTEARGKFNPLPYPIDAATGDLKVRDDHVDLVNLELHHDTTVANLDGVVSWKAGSLQPGEDPNVREKIKITAHDLTWDEDLLAALPPKVRPWLEKLGGSGKLTIDGAVDGPTPTNETGLNLNLTLADGTAWPINGAPSLNHVSGRFHLDDDQLTLVDAHAYRGKAPISMHGQVRFPGEQPSFAIDASAKELVFDPGLYAMIPGDAQAGWDQIKPAGTGDAWLSYSSDGRSQSNVDLTVVPKAMSATPAVVPYRLDDLTGSLKVEGRQVTLADVTAKHGGAAVRLSGGGNLSSPNAPSAWQFKLAADNVAIDDDLTKALPNSLSDFAKSMKLVGNVNFAFSNLSVKPQPATTKPAVGDDDPDIDFAMTLNTPAASFDVGVPMQNVKGSADLTGTARKGRLDTLGGSFTADSASVGGRQLNNFHADLLKAAGRDQLTIGRIQAEMAHGGVAGQIDYAYPQHGLSRYRVDLVLQNADVKQLTGETDRPINGLLSASVALEGAYDRPLSRRGRGDVTVTGQEMYKIPVLLGLLQVTNLSLPINEPFTEATARYGIEGNRVSFEDIELRARDMMMQGDGVLDFGTKQVKLNFVTDSQNWAKIPLIGPVIEGARHELLQIHVKGTLQEPQVTAGSLYTLTTTVDQVINGEENLRAPKQKKSQIP